jgi:glycosyltransferase involved in cell wall biosynthesis
LREAIESALAQTYPRVEVIVINDGSTDNGATEAIAKSFGDRIRYYSKPNGHVSSALNLAIAHMQGDYFSWLSHDDLYSPDKVATQVRALERLDDRTIVYGDFATLDVATGEREVHRLPSIPPEHFRWFITTTSALHGCTLMIPRTCFEECGTFDTSLRTTQDYEMWFRLAERFRFVHVPGVVVTGRQHAAQVTNTLRDVVDHECDALIAQFVSRLTDEDLRAANEPSAAGAYVALAARSQARGFKNARDAAIVLAQSSARQESVFRALSTGVDVLVRVRLKPRLRRLYRIGLSKARGVARRIRMRGLGRTARQRFTRIYDGNLFHGEESRSGEGSSLAQTEHVRQELPLLLSELGVRTVVDAPCGDFNWLQHTPLDLDLYIGADIVDELISKNNHRHGTPQRQFLCADLIRDPLPRADLILCRDCLVHLNFEDTWQVLRNFQRSGAKYLLTTTFTERKTNKDLGPQDVWRTLNLQLPPFNLPPPMRLINERCTESDGAYTDKCLGLWRLQELQLG